ncbi:MAG: endo-1,4-beta-xylanase [Clostridia bacterium]|nr:endo-1,4-beta-xylanase [Clostridia bacterium]
MDLIGSLTGSNNVRGITLNNQQIDLFNIIEQTQSREEAIKRINEYLEDILQASKLSKEMSSQGLSTAQKIKRIVEEKADDVPNKEEFLKFLYKNAMQIRANWDTRDSLEKLFEGQEIDSTYIDEILNIKKYFAYQTHGILTFLVNSNGQTINPESTEISIDTEKTFQKVEALYDYVVGSLEKDKKRFTRLTLDGQGRFGTVAGVIETEKEANAQPEDYNLTPLRQGYEFARKNEMNEVYINALVFFKDFPDRLVGETKEQFETALINYGKAVASVAKEYEAHGIHTVVDMFNEFVDYYAPFSERTNNWMSKLSIEDLCKVAVAIKEEMPNADFGYNDWNFENSDKRAVIFEVIKKIQKYEKDNNCKIIDHIGTQCHTSINEKDIEGLRQSVEELQQFGLPIDITELDISKGLEDVDYETATPEELAAIRKYEQKLQNDVMKMISEFVKEGKIRGVTSWSITDELCCDFCDGKEASVIGMRYDSKNGFTFFGKDMDKVIEMTEQEMRLIRGHQSRVRENNTREINQNPTQDFCFHTHTGRCGHGAKDTGDEEWVQNAIKGGIKKIAFTDHIPLPDGYNKTPKSRMDIAEVESYLTSIRYLQEKYKGQIEIESGFEFEYSDRDLAHLQELKSKTDKMILGQHFVIDADGREHGIARGKGGKQISDEVLEMYGESIISAMDKGLPDVIAHPDLFMQARDKFGVKEEEITRAICKKAIEKGIPLEINFGKIASKVDSGMSIEDIKKRTPYPSPEFWKIVAEETRTAKENGQDLRVIYGKDAHFPGQLSTERDYEIAKAIIGEQTLEQLQIVTSYKELENTRSLTWRQIGKVTTRDFSSNPEQASKALKTLETGVRTQEEIKEGQTQGEE